MPKRHSPLFLLALAFALAVAALFLYAAWQIRARNPVGFGILIIGGTIGGVLLYRGFTAESRRRRAVLQEPFPEAWRSILREEVDFYNELTEEERPRFEQRVQLFLGLRRVTGIDTEIDDEVRVLVAASAVIPIFAFPDWDYPHLEEVLIYPGAFTRDFARTGAGRDVLGMVGDGAMSRVVILSKPALLSGFRRHRDGYNTGIHEFVHLIDAADGAYDGVPALLSRPYVGPWLDLMHREMQAIRHGDSDIREYGGTKKEEFFAVASEYFFEKPDLLAKENPRLYQMMSRIFRQDTLRRLRPSFLKRAK